MGGDGPLPSDPLQLFGLSEGYEPIDLKRAYARLIRIYKPESHPDEFMRIRRAYEQMESGFHLKQQSPFAPVHLPASSNDEFQGHREVDEPDLGQDGTLWNQPVGTLQDLHDELGKFEAKKIKRESDYVRTALLEVAGGGEGRARAIERICDGLAEHPGSDALRGMLFEAALEWPDSLNPLDLLDRHERLAKPHHYGLDNTFPYWLEAFRRRPFADVGQRFEAFIGRCSDCNPLAILSLVRLAVFRADEGWIQRLRSTAESQLLKVDHGDAMLDDLDLAMAYRDNRVHLLVQQSPFFEKLDDAITSAFSDPHSPQAQAKVAHFADEVARSGLQALPVNSTSSVEFPVLLIIWEGVLDIVFRSPAAKQDFSEFATSTYIATEKSVRLPFHYAVYYVLKMVLLGVFLVIATGGVISYTFASLEKAHIANADNSIAIIAIFSGLFVAIAWMIRRLWRKYRRNRPLKMPYWLSRVHQGFWRGKWAKLLINSGLRPSMAFDVSLRMIQPNASLDRNKRRAFRADWPLGIYIAAKQALGYGFHEP